MSYPQWARGVEAARRLLTVAGMHVSVERASRGWKVRVEPESGPPRVYRYATRAQARFFAAVFELGPEALPTEHQIQERARRGKSPAEALKETAEILF